MITSLRQHKLAKIRCKIDRLIGTPNDIPNSILSSILLRYAVQAVVFSNALLELQVRVVLR